MKSLSNLYKSYFLLLFLTLASFAIQGKVYDCFTFFNELELLEVRLNELNDVVDKFVLVEMNETFQGGKKPLIFKENQHKFQKFIDKIIYIGVDNPIDTKDPWKKEAFQRNQIIRGLSECTDDDIILISDVDEIVHHNTIAKISNALKYHEVVRCQQRMFRYFLNMEESMWTGTFACHFNYLKNWDIDTLRKSYIHFLPPPISNNYIDIKNTGWHFTSMGGVARFVTKIESFSHTPANSPGLENMQYVKSPQYIIDHIQKHCHLVNIDFSYPEFILNNIDAFYEKGFIFDSEI
jgi:hypothetical protein